MWHVNVCQIKVNFRAKKITRYRETFRSVQSLSLVCLFATHGPWHTRPSCPSPTPGIYSNSCPLSRWCHPTILSCRPLLLPSVFPSIRVFPDESVLHIRWPKYWVSASASILLMNIQDCFPSGWTGWISLQSEGHYIMIKRSIHQKDTEILSGTRQITELQNIWSKNLKETETIPQLLLEISTALSQPTERDENQQGYKL